MCIRDRLNVHPSALQVWNVFGQGTLNGDMGGGFMGQQITSGLFHMYRAWGITSETQLLSLAIGALVMAGLMFNAGVFHYHRAAPKLEWFQNVESMLNHHLAGLFGLGSLSWTGHLIHVSIPTTKLMDAIDAGKPLMINGQVIDSMDVIPLPHQFLFHPDYMAQLYPGFGEGLGAFFSGNWGAFSDFLTFNGGLNPVTGSLWMTDIAHHHLAIAVLFIIAGHMYRTNWNIGHSLKEILEGHKGDPMLFPGAGHKGLYEFLTKSWHAQLSLNLAMTGSVSIIVAQHMYAMPPYPYMAVDYPCLLYTSPSPRDSV